MSKWKESATESWRTTTGGILAGIGLALICVDVLPSWSWVKPSWVQECGTWGIILTVAGIIFLGIAARDHHA